MPTFKYVAKDQNAKSVVGKMVAEDQGAVIEELRTRKLTIISVDQIKEAAKTTSSFARKKVKPDDIVIFSRMLATMVEAGIPILQALDAMQEQIEHQYFKSVIISVRDDIQSGSSLSAGFGVLPAPK